MNNYTVFHLHDDTSNCNGYADSCTKYDEYIKLAKKNEMSSIAFSNHGGIYDWVKKKQSCDKAKIKYIHGIELYMCTKLEENIRGYHIGLYSKNLDGVKELNTLASLSTSKGSGVDDTDRHSYYNPRISLNEIMNTSENIIITSACLNSVLWRCHYTKKIEIMTEEEISKEYNNWIDTRDTFLKWMAENNNRCFLEIQYHNHPDQIKFNQMLYQWSIEYKIPLIAGTDTHSSTKYKAECRAILQKSKNSFYGDEDQFDMIWKTYDELIECFKIQNALPNEVYIQAIENTNLFADLIDNFELDKSFKYPALYGNNASKVWIELIQKMFKEKIENGSIDTSQIENYKKQINTEFKAMSGQHMDSFMIFMSELMVWCRENDINSAPCRGSVGGSLIAYITDITDVDPIVWNTVFSRFCNADRVSLADIDQDFSPKDRPKVYQYIIDRFGNKNVSYILTLGTIQDRGSIDVLAKGLDYKDLDLVKKIKNSYDESFNKYAKIIQEEINLEEFEGATSTAPTFDDHKLYIKHLSDKEHVVKDLISCKGEWDKLREDNKDLFYYFDGLKGTIVNKGNHAAGMIGSPVTLFDNLGIFYKDGDENFPVSFCSMKAVDSLNYVKFDILGLKTVGIIQDAFKMAGVDWKYSYQMNWKDKKVWEDMIRCNSAIFQFEGEYAHGLLKKMISNKTEEATINMMSMTNAALRPSGKSYRDKLVAGEINQNPSKEIDDLLTDNNGWLIFQEDTIKFLTDICGFDGALADTTRRCIGKKDTVGLNEQLPKILDGYCNKSSHERVVAEEEAKQFIQIISDSSDYQFGYNHSTGYSMLGYMAAYARTYFKLELITSYFNWCENDEDYANGMKMIKEYAVTLKSPKFRYSKGGFFFDKETNSIYKGIGSLKFFSEGVGNELYELRNNPYDDFVDLLIDIKNNTNCGDSKIELLIKIDFFSEFGGIKKLLNVFELFNKWYSRKTLSKSIVSDLGLDNNLIQNYATDKLASGKISAKEYKINDNIGIIKCLSDKGTNEEIGISELIKYQLDILGYIDYVNEDIDKKYIVITSLDTTYSPKFMAYCINNGMQIEMKAHNLSKRRDKAVGKYYQEEPFIVGDIIFMKDVKLQPVKKNIDGEWVVVADKKEWWVKDYVIIKNLN